MLKEKLYLEYQQLYRSYQDRYQKADELVLEVKQLEQKVAAEQAALKAKGICLCRPSKTGERIWNSSWIR